MNSPTSTPPSRLMLGHGDWSDPSRYELQTIKDNLMLFTPEILDRINREVVSGGAHGAKKNAGRRAKRAL